MESTFGKRLFRLFLLFSLTPSIILALIGYYFASESSFSHQPDQQLFSNELTGYYNDFAFQHIKAEVLQSAREADAGQPSIDFLVEISDTIYTATHSRGPITPALVEKLATVERDQGFIQQDSIFYQYCRIGMPDGGFVVGGMIHGPEYGRLMQAVQANQARVSSRRALLGNYLYFLAVMFVVIGLVTLIMSYYFSSRIARSLSHPLLELSRASRRIAGGDFNQQVESSGVGEIQTLITNFNLMARRLEITTTRLAQSERVAAWRQVARRFAHELKNPLQPIMVSLYRIEKSLEDSDHLQQIKEPLRAASEELKHLTELAERFSRLAKLPPAKLETVCLNDLLASVAELYREQMTDYDFAIKLPAEKMFARIDATYFREALHNLLKNAAEATESRGKIELSLGGTESDILIRVQDNGKGMSQEVASSARIPYYTTRSDGSGLGLAVVDKTVNEISGSLIIESEEGAGTTVTISLPRTEEDADQNSDS